MRYVACAVVFAFVSTITGRVSVPLHAQSSRSTVAATPDVVPTVSQYLDPLNGVGLTELVQFALTRNADLLATRQRTLEAQGLLRQAGFRPNPVVETEFSTGSATSSPGEGSFTLGYAHTFELGGKRARRVDVGAAGLDIARLEVTDRERTIRAELQERYITAMAAIRNLDAVAQQFELTKSSYTVTQRRVAEGESPQVEEMVLQAEAGRLDAERLLLGSEAQQAMLDVRVVAGFDLSEPLALRPDGDRPPTNITLDAALEQGLTSRPDLRAARQEEERTQAEVRLAQAERVPDVAAIVRYSDVQSRFPQLGLSPLGMLTSIQDRDHLLTGGLSITLPLLYRNQGQIEAARARQSAASLRREYVERSIRAEITGAYGRYLAARRAVHTFEDTVLRPSTNSVRVLRASYDLGEIRVFDLLTEQRRLIDTQKAYTDALKQEALARVALERAIGLPLP